MAEHTAAINRGLTQARSYLTSAMVYAGRSGDKRLEGMVASARADVDVAMEQLKNPKQKPAPGVDRQKPEPAADDD